MRAGGVAVATAAAIWAMPGTALAGPDVAPTINWVFVLSLLMLGLFLAFCGFVFLYYLVGVAVRNRKLAVGQGVEVPAGMPVSVAAGRTAPVAAAAAVGAPASARAAVASAAPAPVATPAAAPVSAAAPAAAATTPAAPVAEAAPAAQPAAQPAAVEPAADLGDVPRIDPNVLPDGIGAVERGLLKKLAVFQSRGKQPPADLIERLRPILDQMQG